MIFPCIDLMGGKVVQLVQGRNKVLDGDSLDAMLDKFASFPQIQVIDLDAAKGQGTNSDLVQRLASKAKIRAGGGVRTAARARELLMQGAFRVIVGTSAFRNDGLNHDFLKTLVDTAGSDNIILALDSRDGRIVIKGWEEATQLTAEVVIAQLAPYCSGFLCTYVDKEGMMQGTDLEWFRRLRNCTDREITAAGGITTIEDVKELEAIGVDSAIGMAIYTGRIDIDELVKLAVE